MTFSPNRAALAETGSFYLGFLLLHVGFLQQVLVLPDVLLHLLLPLLVAPHLRRLVLHLPLQVSRAGGTGHEGGHEGKT